MTLPKNVPIKQARKKKTIWLYGEPYTGKTTFASGFPNHLFITTDGNIRELMTYAPDEKPPNVEIKDEVTLDGRITRRTFAWEAFRQTVSALETQDTEFDTIVIDHLGDLYEHCRLYIYNREGIMHETEEGYGKAWDMVKTEFLSTIKRVVNLDYENIILISHEDRSKDIAKKGDNKLTAIRPKVREAYLSNIAGMVDITARTIAEDGKYILSFKTSEVIFGGGRLKPNVSEIPLEYGEFVKLYDNGRAAAPGNIGRAAAPGNIGRAPTPGSGERAPAPRARKPRSKDKPEPAPEPAPDPEPASDPPKAPERRARLTRKKREYPDDELPYPDGDRATRSPHEPELGSPHGEEYNDDDDIPFLNVDNTTGH